MKNRYFIIACAAAVIATGCAKEAMDNASTSSQTVLSVTIADGSKTTLGELSEGSRPIYWSNGDVMCCNGVSSAALSDVPEKAKAAEFTFEGVLERPYKLLYPASLYKDAATITLPAVSGNIPLGGQDGSISALTGIIKLTVKGGDHQDKISYVKVSSSTAQLSGDFTIDYAAGTLTATSSDDADKSVKAVIGQTLEKDETVELFIPVPAGSYGFTVRIVDVMGHFMEKSTTAPKNIVAGQINAFPELVFAPTGTQFDVEIDSAEKLVKFAQDYNAGAFEQDPIVCLTKDIVFDDATNAAFLATGGIGVAANEELGTPDNYFNGAFYGQNHSIKNWKSYSVGADGAITDSAPLFAYSGGAGYIQDLVLDSSCDLKFPKGYAAPLVGRHKAKLLNCTNNADVTLLMQAGKTYFGGLVGRVYGGTIENCTMNGMLKNQTEVSSTKEYNVGGIAATLENGGKISGCSNSKNIIWRGNSGAAGPQLKNGGTLYLGGIVGNLIKGTVSACAANAPTTDSNDIRGNAGTCAIGGIAGYVQSDGIVENCKNNRIYYVRLSSGTVLNLGGIAGNNEGTLKGANINTAEISGNSGHLTICVGGLAGNNEGSITSTVEGNANTGKIIGPKQYTTISCCYLGGLVGKSTTALSKMSNGGDVTCNPNAGINNTSGMYIAGCVAYASATLSELSNAGAVSLGGSNWKVSADLNDMVLGGIVSVVESESPISISKCNNSGSIQIVGYADGGLSSTAPNAIVGGVSGVVKNGGASVSYCNNTGLLYNSISQNGIAENQSMKTAGIVAYAKGSSQSKVSIDNCKNIATSGKRYYGARGYLGGIVAWADNTIITNCESTMEQTGNLGWYSGGIAARMVASTVMNSTARCGIVGRYIRNGSAGGITATMDEASKVLNSEYFGAIAAGDNQTDVATKLGGIAGQTVSGAEISNCRFGGTIKSNKNDSDNVMTEKSICSDTNFTVNEANTLITE